METEIITKPSAELQVSEENDKDLVQAFEDVGIDNHYIAHWLKHILDNTETANPKTGDMMEDYATKLQAIKTWQKIVSWKPDISIQIANVFPTGQNIL